MRAGRGPWVSIRAGRAGPGLLLAVIAFLSSMSAVAQPIVFYGDAKLPPYEFLEAGEPKGANVDLIRAVGRVLGRPVEIRLGNWSESQAAVLAGEGDALTLLAPTPEREAHYAFTRSTFRITFSLFVRAAEAEDFTALPLARRRIGVTAGGLPRDFFQERHPDVPLVLVGDNEDGVRRLLRGEIDALAVNTWSGNRFLYGLGITGVVALPEPFAERPAAIAVPLADQTLRAELDAALAQVIRDGTFDRIVDQWSGQRIHLFNEREVWLAGLALAATLAALVLTVVMLVLAQARRRALAREIAERRKIEAAQVVAHARVEALQRLSAAFSRARTPVEVAQTAVRAGGEAAGAPRGTLGLLVDQGRAFELVAAVGYRGGDLERWRRFPNKGRLPVSDAVARREPVVIGRRAEVLARYPDLAGWMESSGYHGSAVFPLIVNGGQDARVLGFIAFDYDRDHDFAPAEVAFLGALADLCAQALDRALAYTELERRVEERTAQFIQAQKMEVVGQLTGGVAHDFNNVLQAVGSCLAVLERHVPSGDPRILFEAAQQSIERGARLTQSLLAFARRQTLTPAPTDPAALLTGMVPLLERTLGGLIRITTDMAPDVFPALVDQAQLESAVLNLAINARDAMPQGGTLFLRARNVTLTRFGESGHPPDLRPGDYVEVTVEDTGFGMDPAVLTRVFEPFFTTKGPGKGSGLGLSMVHGMAAQSGGGVAIASAPGRGTKVSIYLPRAESAPAKVDRRLAAEGEVREGTVALLVDDDAIVRLGTAAMLEGLGYRVRQADGGAAALEALRDHPDIEVMITDYAMPGMNGGALVKEARSLVPGLPVLLVTGYADMPDGMEDVALLVKPFRVGELAAILTALVNGARAPNVVPFVAGRGRG